MTLISVSLARVIVTFLGAGGSVHGQDRTDIKTVHDIDTGKLIEGSDILLEQWDLPNSSVKSVTLHLVPFPAEFSAKI